MAQFNHIITKPLNGVTMIVNIKPIYTHEFGLRMWLGTRLVRLAAWVLGCNVQFEPGG